jgi:hypothetical protein
MEFLKALLSISLLLLTTNCNKPLENEGSIAADEFLEYKSYSPAPSDTKIDRAKYIDKLHGFWLGQCIANWTGLITEMDKIGNVGEIKTGPFYTRDDWGKPDLPSIWSEGKPSDLSPKIDFIYAEKDSIWGSDDDTDIEYMYQFLLYENQTSMLSSQQIQKGWLKHIKEDEENFIWVSNQRAYDLMKSGILPPHTGDPANNPDYDMIDAQLTTEIFGLFAPNRPDIALKMAELPIKTTARQDAQLAAEFYVILHSLAAIINPKIDIGPQLKDISAAARKHLPEHSYTAKMYDFVDSCYTMEVPWEKTRDALYERYQVKGLDGYNITSRNLYCNGCFASGINFGSSLISLFYGEGDIKETIKIGTLCGWDSDNPTATWGGLIGFIIGKSGIEEEFATEFSDKFNIHRTRRNFPNNGIDNFDAMATKGVYIIDRVVQEEMSGGIDLKKNHWYVPEQ